MTTPALELTSVRAAYGNVEVLHGVDLAVGRGEVHALLGPNGAGKSTLLATCIGLLTPVAGSVRVAGHDVVGGSVDGLARAGLCLVPEGRGVFPNLTVAENVRMFTHVFGNYRDLEERVYAQFPRLGERRRQVAGTLSGGEQQMLAISRALATDPAVLLIDELSMGLAPIIVAMLYDHVAELALQGMSIVVVEQFAHAVLGISTSASVMVNGHIIRTGTPQEIGDQLVEDYLGSSEGAA